MIGWEVLVGMELYCLCRGVGNDLKLYLKDDLKFVTGFAKTRHNGTRTEIHFIA